jgi:Mg/Co/Ni transporter MgtE
MSITSKTDTSSSKFPKVDISSLEFKNPIDRLRSATEDRLHKIVDETTNTEIAESFEVLHDSVCLKILMYLDHGRLVDVFSLLPDHQLANIFSWKNNEILISALTSFTIDNNSKMLVKILGILDQDKLVTVSSSINTVAMADVLGSIIFVRTMTKDRNYLLNRIISALLCTKRIIPVLDEMSDKSLEEMFPLINSSELNKIIPLLDQNVLRRILPKLDDINLGYILSRVDCLSLVRSLL